MVKFDLNFQSKNTQLLSIKPDNKVLEFHKNPQWPFVSCANMIQKSIYDYYQVNEIVSHVQNIFAYEFIENEKRLAFSYSIIPLNEKNGLTNFFSLGFRIKNYNTRQDQPIQLIKDIIDRDHPIMCMLDIYYLEGRELYYHSHHGGHYILITGYDDDKGVVYLMDNVAGYAIYECSYKEMVFYIDQTRLMEGGADFDFLWEVSYDKQCDTYDTLWIENVVNEYKDKVESVKGVWERNYKELNTMKERLGDLILQREFPTNIESLLYRMSSELYSMIYLIPYNIYIDDQYEHICELKKNVIGKWKVFERKLLHKKLRNDNNVDGFMTILSEIQNIENEINQFRL